MFLSGDINDKFLEKLAAEETGLALCSSGGETEVMAAALDIMETRELPTTATGRCYSAAVPIVASGLKGARQATERTRFMVHPASLMTGRNHSVRTLKENAAELKYFDDMYFEALGKHTKLSANDWRALCRGGEFYFNARQAKQFGVIDRVVYASRSRGKASPKGSKTSQT